MQPNKFLNLILATLLILSQTTLQASLSPNFQISQTLQSNLNSLSIEKFNTTNLSLQTTNYIISNGKVKFDLDSLTKSAISAGVGSLASSYINDIEVLNDTTLNPNNSNFLNLNANNSLNFSYQNFAKAALNSVTNAGIQSGIYGTNFKDNLVANLTNSLGDNLYKVVGDIGLNQGLQNSDFEKILMHSVVGGSISAMQGDSFKDGAIISATTQALNPLSKNLNQNQQMLISQMSGIITGALLNGDDGANLGYTLSTSAEANNRQLHDFYTLKDIQNLNDLDSNEAGIENKINILIQYGLSKEEIAKSLQNMAEFKALTKDGMSEFNKIYNTEKEKVDKTNNLVDNIATATEIIGIGVMGVAGVENTVKNSGKKIVKDTVENNVKKQITNKETALEIFNSMGIKSTGKGSKNVRLVKDENELNLAWGKLTKNAKDINPVLANDGTTILRKKLNDGTIIKYRPTSKSGGATIEIEPTNGGIRKIHY